MGLRTLLLESFITTPCLQESHPKGGGRRTTFASFSSSKSLRNASSRGNVVHIQNSAVRKSENVVLASQALHTRKRLGWYWANPSTIFAAVIFCVFIQDVGKNWFWTRWPTPRRCSPDRSDGYHLSNLPRVMVITGSWDLNPVLTPITKMPILPFNFIH